MSGKKIISLYPENSPFKILDQAEWWDDSFDATKYGRDFDFNRPFFEQYKDLQKDVPRWARIVVNSENSDYANNCAGLRNSYLSFSSYESENLLYCMRVFKSNDCVDCLNVNHSQFCSRCADSQKCYNLHYSLMCNGSSDSFYLFDCRNCKNCILSSQQNGKEYMFANQQCTKEEYEEKKTAFLQTLHSDKNALDEQFVKMVSETPHRHLHQTNTQNCTGNFINNSKNIRNGYYVIDSEDCVNVYDSSYLKNCYDNSYNEESELCLEIDTAYRLYDVKFCTYSMTLKESAYCDQCGNSDHCFGCIGIKKQKYMILNKQYSKEDYEEMMKKIKAHMQETGEWGKPFPSTLTTFPYNTTIAYEHYPLSKEEAISQGYMWHDEEPEVIAVEDALTCKISGKQYKVIPQEAEFYEKFSLPTPKISPEQRYKELVKFQAQKNMTTRACSSCQKETQTVYPEESGVKILCEECYLAVMY
jgi:hypothetical protein